jgi:hypothetical protein
MDKRPPTPVPRPAATGRRLAGGGRARAVVAWAALGFVAAQLGLLLAMEDWRPELRDPEFGYKLALLRQRLKEAPGRPLVLVLGSSRTVMGFRPEALPEYQTASGEVPLVFNFGIGSCNSLRELLYFRRLLKAGVRPQRALIEVLPVFQALRGEPENMLLFDRVGWHDLPVLCSFGSPAGPLYRRWAEERLWPWFTYRYGLVSRFAPELIPVQNRQDCFWTALDRLGWRTCGFDTVTPEAYQRGVAASHKDHGTVLEHDFCIGDVPDRALRELLSLCQREGVAAALFTMPEATVYQSWYTPQARGTVAAYLDRLAREYHIPVFDARDWAADAAFFDGQHLLPCGAQQFTERFGREVLRPLLEGPGPRGAHFAAVR